MVVLNSNTQQRDHLVRILLPSPSYKALVWDTKEQKFKETETDIFEQRHFDKLGNAFEDSIMYLKAAIDIDSVGIIKLVKIDENNKKDASNLETSSSSDQKKTNALSLLGISNENYLTFKYENKA